MMAREGRPAGRLPALRDGRRSTAYDQSNRLKQCVGDAPPEDDTMTQKLQSGPLNCAARRVLAAVMCAACALTFTVAGSGCGNGDDTVPTQPTPENTPDAPQGPDVTTTSMTFDVEGMSCSGCENAIQQAVRKLAGVSSCTASHESGTVTVEATNDADVEAIADAIAKLNFNILGRRS